MALSIGSSAPDFTLPSTSGTTLTLSKHLKGKACIIYFYPKDFTAGCTREACGFGNIYHVLCGLNIDVFGISHDSIQSHKSFKERYQLPFDLLSDLGGKVSKSYNAQIPFIQKPKRVTYLLDKNHEIAAVYQNMMNPSGHIRKMISALKSSSFKG